MVFLIAQRKMKYICSLASLFPFSFMCLLRINHLAWHLFVIVVRRLWVLIHTPVPH